MEIPNNADEGGLRRLSAQLKAGKVVVKLFLRHTLHAKLFLVHRTDPNKNAEGSYGKWFSRMVKKTTEVTETLTSIPE